MTKEQRLIQIYQAQREHAHNQLAAVAAEFDEMKMQRDSAFAFLSQCFRSGRLPCEGVAAISGLNAWIEANKVAAPKEPLATVSTINTKGKDHDADDRGREVRGLGEDARAEVLQG